MTRTRDRVLVSWSGGKDCCMALHALRASGDHDVAGLLTTVRAEDGRVGMHGVPRELIEQQAMALGLPLTIAPVPAGASNIAYEKAFAAALDPWRQADVRTVAFGDLFLADIRQYREQLMERLGLVPLFPIWARDTRALVEQFVTLGFRALVVSVDPARLDPDIAGRTMDAALLADLPAGIDPCGENGEFHSFVFDGPGFAKPIGLRVGQRSFDGHLCYRTITAVPAERPRGDIV